MPRRAPWSSMKALLTVGLAMAVGVLVAAGVTGPGPVRTSWSQGSAPEPAQQQPAEPAVTGPPRMEIEGRFFTAGGEPLFWLGDTAWALLGKLDRADTVRYLDARSEQGYNVIQAVAIFPQAGANRPIRGDVRSAPEHGAFWDNVDFVIDAAAERGMYLAIHPVWGDKQTGSLLQLILKSREPECAPVSDRGRRSVAARGGCRGVAGPGRVCRAGAGR